MKMKMTMSMRIKKMTIKLMKTKNKLQNLKLFSFIVNLFVRINVPYSEFELNSYSITQIKLH